MLSKKQRWVVRVVKDGRMEVGKLFLFGGGDGVICLYHVFFWLCFLVTYPKGLLGITMKLIRTVLLYSHPIELYLATATTLVASPSKGGM